MASCPITEPVPAWQNEFRETYVEFMKGEGKSVSDEEYEAVWKKIDKDGDGTLSCEELANHYGFNLSKPAGSEPARPTAPPAG